MCTLHTGNKHVMSPIILEAISPCVLFILVIFFMFSIHTGDKDIMNYSIFIPDASVLFILESNISYVLFILETNTLHFFSYWKQTLHV